MQQRTPHVLIVAWDGVRDDERTAAHMPHALGLPVPDGWAGQPFGTRGNVVPAS